MRHWLLLTIFVLLTVLPTTAQNTYPGYEAVWNEQSRFTILVMGIDRRPDDISLSFLNDVRADLLMVVSYDPATRRIGILSIPRDLHVALADTGELVRVNTLLVLGEQKQLGYGPYFMMETLQYNLGMYLDGFVAFDFQAFINMVDALGGVEIDVKETINDSLFPDMNYDYDPLYLRPGLYRMNGYDTLRYLRTRHGDNDYRRGERQLQVLQAIYQRLQEPTLVQTLVTQAPLLYADLQGHIYTNLRLDNAITLGLAMNGLGMGAIATGALNESYSYNYDGVRVPDRGRMPLLLATIFGENYGQ